MVFIPDRSLAQANKTKKIITVQPTEPAMVSKKEFFSAPEMYRMEDCRTLEEMVVMVAVIVVPMTCEFSPKRI